jgi:hypothetical protein
MMKRFTIVFLCCASFSAFSQTSKKTFVITSGATTPAAYNHISSIDINAGKQLADIFDISKRYAYRNNAMRGYEKRTDDRYERTPMAGAVACMAFDAKNNRLYYVPQHLSELRYLDLKQPEPSFTCFESQSLNLMHNKDDVANQISRMTIGADGFGYALTNDGEHLIRFSTQETPVIQDLGVLVDNPSNQVMVRSSCTSWGGDIVAASDGSLYLITGRNHIFKVNISSRKADYVGMIKNLPQEFTSNGASVDEDGNLMVSCGSSMGKNFSALYKVNMNSFEAQPVAEKMGVGNISDMASSNLLFQKNDKQQLNGSEIAFMPASTPEAENDLPKVSIFPNPLRSNGRFQVTTSNFKEKGEYRISLVDAAGKAVMDAKMNISTSKTSQSFNFPSRHAKGVYFVQVTDPFNRTVYSQQLIVE